jgi:uncharacterized ion transporter superfamily protein YfcC
MGDDRALLLRSSARAADPPGVSEQHSPGLPVGVTASGELTRAGWLRLGAFLLVSAAAGVAALVFGLARDRPWFVALGAVLLGSVAVLIGGGVRLRRKERRMTPAEVAEARRDRVADIRERQRRFDGRGWTALLWVVTAYWVVWLVAGVVNQAWTSVAISTVFVLMGAASLTRRHRRRSR